MIYLLSTISEKRVAAKAAAEEAELNEIRAERYAKDSKFNDWHNKLKACYGSIEKNVTLNQVYDPGDLYDCIWKLEKVQPEPRYKATFDDTLARRIHWLREKVDYNLRGGYYAASMCLSAVQCLKKAFHDDSGFDPVIKTFKELYERSQCDTFYLQFPQYGDCKLPVADTLHSTDLDDRIAVLKNKMDAIDASIDGKIDDYYSNISSDLANYIDYAKKGNSFLQIEHVEQLLALIYAKNLIGSQNTANQERKRIMEWVDAAISFEMTEQCYLLPSALAWMGLYELERDVLRHLVERKVSLPEEWQDRLGFLESGGTSNIKIYEVSTADGFLYDSSSSEWNTDAFDLFFRKLEMSHKVLSYSLAISKWTKTLPLAHGQKVTQEQFEQAFMRLVEDFDGEVTVRKESAKALNLANVEYKNSFIFRFTSERSRCVSILFSSEKYGRNLNLTIIVLFTPDNKLTSVELRKYALAIKDNIYVESFKESIFQAVNEVINPEQPIYGDETADNESDIFE